MAKVVPKGRLRLQHFGSAFPLQIHPGLSLPDLMANASIGQTHLALKTLGDDVLERDLPRIERYHEGKCIHLYRPRLSSNSRIHSARRWNAGSGYDTFPIDFVIDQNVAIEQVDGIPRYPSVYWDIEAGDNDHMRLLCKPGRDGSQKLALVCGPNGSPVEMRMIARTERDCQGFTFRCARSVFGSQDADTIPTGTLSGLPWYQPNSNYELRFTAGFQALRVRVHKVRHVVVEKNDAPIVEVTPITEFPDKAGVDEKKWVTIAPRLITGNPNAVHGNSKPDDPLEVEVRFLNNKVSINIEGENGVYVVPGEMLGPSEAPTVMTGGGEPPAHDTSVAYSWVDVNSHESTLSPASLVKHENSPPHSSTVRIPVGPPTCIAVKIYASDKDSKGWRLQTTLVNSGSDGVFEGIPYFNHEVVEPDAGEEKFAGYPRPVISSIEVRANFFSRFDWELHPHWWVRDGEMTSPPQTFGFISQKPFYFTVYGGADAAIVASGEPWNRFSKNPLTFPEGGAITPSLVGSPPDPNPPGYDHVRYKLKLTGHSVDLAAENFFGQSDLCQLTPIVTRVNTCVDGKYQPCGTEPYFCVPSRAVVPKRISERIVFQTGSKTIVHTLDFTLDNWRGEWATQNGNVAVKLWLGIKAPLLYPGIRRPNKDPTIDTDGSRLWQRFEGFASEFDFDFPAANRAVVNFGCTDRMEMFDVPVINPPLMDGWNDYAAIAYLAMKAGWTPDRFAFRHLVPTLSGGTLATDPEGAINPFVQAAGDPRGAGAAFLPLGSGMGSWTPRNRTMQVVQLMQFIQKPSGYMLYVDADGELQYHRFIPFSPPLEVKVFTNDPSFWGVDGANLCEYWDLRIHKSTHEVRNQVALIGIDPLKEWYSLHVHRREIRNSIQAPPFAEPMNYIGYPKPFVWIDARFANERFAANSATEIMRMISVPGIEVSFSTWLQPDLFPMDVVFVNDPRAGVLNIPLLIMSMTNEWGVGAGGRIEPRTTITARFLV